MIRKSKTYRIAVIMWGHLRGCEPVQECIGEPIVFALDEALMCQGSFMGRSDEYLIWVYGSDSAARFNGVVVLGNRISSYDGAKEKRTFFYKL